MKNHSLSKISFLNAIGVLAYVSLLAMTLFRAETFFKTAPEYLIPVFMMLIFIISASVTGLLVLGRPIMLYLDGSKKEALRLLFATLGWLALFLIAVVIVALV